MPDTGRAGGRSGDMGRLRHEIIGSWRVQWGDVWRHSRGSLPMESWHLCLHQCLENDEKGRMSPSSRL